MTGSSGALYWSTPDRVTIANYNATGTVLIEANGGTAVAAFGGATYANDFTGTARITGKLTVGDLSAIGTYDGVQVTPGQFGNYALTLGEGGAGLSLYATHAAVFASTATASAFIPSGATVPTNGMYLSAANTLNFATNTTNRFSISSAGAATFSSTVAATSGTFYVGDGINGTYFLGGAGNTARQLKFSTSTTTNVGDTHIIDAQSGTGVIQFATTSTPRLTIASTGAATFSSTVAINGSTVSTEGLSVQYNQAKTYTTSTAVSRWHSNESSGSQFKLNLFAIGNATSSSRVFKFQTSNEGVANDGIIAFQPDGGNVGIGTTSPSKLLSIYSSANTNTAQSVIFDATSTRKLYLGTFSNSAYLSYGGTYSSGWASDATTAISLIAMSSENNDSWMTFGTSQTNGAGPTERMRITSDGNVGIGTTTPGVSLEVNGLIRSIPTYNNTSATLANLVVTSGGTFERSTASSGRYKENITDWNGGLDLILALKPKTFTYKKDYYDKANIHFLGLIAEEVSEVSPYLADYENEDRTGDVENVRYANIVVPLIQAIQEQQAQIEELKALIK
jgi:hypothetical protein